MAKGQSKLSGDEIKQRIQEAAEMLDLVEHLDKKQRVERSRAGQRVALGVPGKTAKGSLMDEPLIQSRCRIKASNA